MTKRNSNAKKEFEARRDMQQLAFNSLSLDEVMKICGYSGEPAGAQHLKYKSMASYSIVRKMENVWIS